MKKSSKIIITLLITASISPTVSAAQIPIESAPCNATIEGICIAEQLISEQLTAVQNGIGFQAAWAKAKCIVYHAALDGRTNGHSYSEIANIARNAIYQHRDMYLRPEYYESQNERVYVLIADLIEEVRNGRDYDDALTEAYTRIYQTVNPAYVPDEHNLIDKIYLDIPPADAVMFSRARKFLLEAKPQI